MRQEEKEQFSAENGGKTGSSRYLLIECGTKQPVDFRTATDASRECFVFRLLSVYKLFNLSHSDSPANKARRTTR